jgi:hypothetical protein
MSVMRAEWSLVTQSRVSSGHPTQADSITLRRPCRANFTRSDECARMGRGAADSQGAPHLARTG